MKKIISISDFKVFRNEMPSYEGEDKTVTTIAAVIDHQIFTGVFDTNTHAWFTNIDPSEESRFVEVNLIGDGQMGCHFVFSPDKSRFEK